MSNIKKYLFSFIASCLIALASAFFASVSKQTIFIFSVPLMFTVLWMSRNEADIFLLPFFVVVLSLFMMYIPYFTPVVLSLFMLSLPIYILMISKSSDVLKDLGFSGSIKRAVLLSFIFIIPAVIIILILTYMSAYLGVDDSEAVSKKISALPFYVLLYAITLGPVAEEVFFRSFLTKYIHPILANIIFAFAHVTYGSFIELLGAFILGIYFYTVFKLTGDIKVAILLHTIINAVSIYVTVN